VALFIALAAGVQTPAPGRIVGRAVDRPDGVAVPGVRVTLTSDGFQRSVVTDNDGRFVLDGINAGTPCSIRAELPGFRTLVLDDVSVGAGETVAIDVPLRVSCIVEAQTVMLSAPERLLMASAVAHLRVLEDGQRRLVLNDDDCWREEVAAPAEILDVVNLSRQVWRSVPTISLSSDKKTLKAGAEYLALLIYEPSGQRFYVSDRATTVGDRVSETDGLDAFGIRPGTTVKQALVRLRDAHRRHAGATPR
jgi:hypothetical protein